MNNTEEQKTLAKKALVDNQVSEDCAMHFLMRYFRGHLNPRIAEEVIDEFYSITQESDHDHP